MNLAAYCLAGAALFVSIKPAPTNLFLALCVLFVLAGRSTRSNLRKLFTHPVAWGSVVFFALLCLSQLYSASTWEQASEYVTKYARIAIIPFLAAALLSTADVLRVLWAFLAGMFLTLVLSYLAAFVPGFCLQVGLLGCGPPENPFVFKLHITHGFFMALASGLSACFAWQAFKDRQAGWRVLLLAGFSLLAAINVLLMIDGRTGWLVFLVFPAVLMGRVAGWKGLLLAMLLGALVLAGMGLFLPEAQKLVQQAMEEYQAWLASGGVAEGRSGMRLTYYYRAIQAMLQQPLFGYGLGGVEQALNLHGVGGGIFALNNPHNQYLLFGVQTGLAGLLVYLAYYGMLVRYTIRNSPMPNVALSFYAAFALGNLFNSFHFDMSESILFAIATAVFLASARKARQPGTHYGNSIVDRRHAG